MAHPRLVEFFTGAVDELRGAYPSGGPDTSTFPTMQAPRRPRAEGRHAICGAQSPSGSPCSSPGTRSGSHRFEGPDRQQPPTPYRGWHPASAPPTGMRSHRRLSAAHHRPLRDGRECRPRCSDVPPGPVGRSPMPCSGEAEVGMRLVLEVAQGFAVRVPLCLLLREGAPQVHFRSTLRDQRLTTAPDLVHPAPSGAPAAGAPPGWRGRPPRTQRLKRCPACERAVAGR